MPDRNPPAPIERLLSIMARLRDPDTGCPWDKEQTFDALETLPVAIAAMTGMVADMTPNAAAMKKAAGAAYSTATDLADWLVRSLGLPFREAHHATGRIVA